MEFFITRAHIHTKPVLRLPLLALGTCGRVVRRDIITDGRAWVNAAGLLAEAAINEPALTALAPLSALLARYTSIWLAVITDGSKGTTPTLAAGGLHRRI